MIASDEDAVEPGADPAGRDLAEQHVEQRDRRRAPPVKLSCSELTAPVEVPVVETANSADAGMPKRTSLPSIAAPAASAAVPVRVASRTPR